MQMLNYKNNFSILSFPFYGNFKKDTSLNGENTLVEHFNVIEDIRPGQIPVWYVLLLMRSFFSELKNNSATALSWQLPRRLKLGARLLARRSGASRHCRTDYPYTTTDGTC